jgi:hypothetical protein
MQQQWPMLVRLSIKTTVSAPSERVEGTLLLSHQ